MANIVELIGRMKGNFTPQFGTTVEQIVFTVPIPPSLLGTKNSLRLTMLWGGCINCREIADNPENVFTETFGNTGQFINDPHGPFGFIIFVSESNLNTFVVIIDPPLNGVGVLAVRSSEG